MRSYVLRVFVTALVGFLSLPAITFAKAPDTSTIRSVTYYDTTFSPNYPSTQMAQALPHIKSLGFNTVWLVNPWVTFNPQPLSQPPVYNEAAFTHLLTTLEIIKQSNMRAIIGLNYLGSSWAPAGIDGCTWTTDPTMYSSFETYTTEFLTRIQNYSDMTYILFFTENAVPCNLAPLYEVNNARQAATTLRATLGSLPSRLPAALRAKFQIGFHDYPLVNLNWAQGHSPIASPNPFDFVSMVGYALDDPTFEDKTTAQITAAITARATNFRNLYPQTPLMIGEFGASSCTNRDANQARVNTTVATYALNNTLGFNLWGYLPGPGTEECTNSVYGGLAITNTDGTAKPAAYDMRGLLVGLVGDLDNNRKIDIFDYNSFVSHFGKTSIVGDLNRNTVIDIFDYNILVSNFGKTI